MKLPLNVSLPTLFMDNFFCLIPNTSLAFVAISKNSVTFLKKVAIYNAINKWVDTGAHNIIGYTEESKYLIPISKMNEYELQNGKLIKFAVWRDPLKRILSTYKFFCLEREYRHYFHYLGLHDDNSFDRFMQFLEFEWTKGSPAMQDEHIRRQVDYYKPSDVNYIVPINQVFNFLSEHKIPFIKEQSNKTNTRFTIKKKKYLDKIEEYYKRDWDIKCNYMLP